MHRRVGGFAATTLKFFVGLCRRSSLVALIEIQSGRIVEEYIGYLVAGKIA